MVKLFLETWKEWKQAGYLVFQAGRLHIFQKREEFKIFGSSLQFVFIYGWFRYVILYLTIIFKTYREVWSFYLYKITIKR